MPMPVLLGLFKRLMSWYFKIPEAHSSSNSVLLILPGQFTLTNRRLFILREHGPLETYRESGSDLIRDQRQQLSKLLLLSLKKILNLFLPELFRGVWL